jgi:hypothetical protein
MSFDTGIESDAPAAPGVIPESVTRIPATAELRCPRCGLSILLRPRRLAMAHCPRCIARHRTLVELLSSALPAGSPLSPDPRQSHPDVRGAGDGGP